MKKATLISALSFSFLLSGIAVSFGQSKSRIVGDSVVITHKNGKIEKFALKDIQGLTVRSVEDPLNNDMGTYQKVQRHYNTNYPKTANMLNGVYVQSFIGMDISALEKEGGHAWYSNLHKGAHQTDTLIAGTTYREKRNIVTEQYHPQLISIHEILQTYAPEHNENKCLFMVDGVLLTHHISALRLDKKQIASVEVIPVHTIPIAYQAKKPSFPESLSLTLLQIRLHGEKNKEKNTPIGKQPSNTLSLQEIIDKYCPEQNTVRLHQRYLFLLNDMPIDPAQKEIRIDASDIKLVQVLNTAELENIHGRIHQHEDLNLIIIRIYTGPEDEGLGRIR